MKDRVGKKQKRGKIHISWSPVFQRMAWRVLNGFMLKKKKTKTKNHHQSTGEKVRKIWVQKAAPNPPAWPWAPLWPWAIQLTCVSPLPHLPRKTGAAMRHQGMARTPAAGTRRAHAPSKLPPLHPQPPTGTLLREGERLPALTVQSFKE